MSDAADPTGGNAKPLPAQWQRSIEQILRRSPEGITVQDRSGRLLFANEAAAKQIGFSSVEELLATPVAELMGGFEIFDEQDRPLDLSALPGRQALLGRHAGPMVMRFRITKTGESRWSSVEAAPVLDARGEVEAAVNIFRDVTDTVRAERSLRFLAEASVILSSSLDYADTLEKLAKLVVPQHADWCTIHIPEPDGAVRVIVAHADPAKVQMAKDIQEEYPYDPDYPSGISEAIRTGKPQLVPYITDEMVKMAARDERHERILREVGLRSGMTVPLLARGRVLGAITFLGTEEGKRYDAQDLEFAMNLAGRAAIAVDNAKLFKEAQHELAERRRAQEQVKTLNDELEARVFERTGALEAEIAERKKAESREHANFLRVQQILDTLPFGALALDEERRVLHANAACGRLLAAGHAAVTLIGRTYDEFKAGIEPGLLDGRTFAASMDDALGAREPAGCEARLVDGRILAMESSPIVVAGSHHGHLLVFRDVTQERRVDAAKTEFMSLASHQLRTPLTAVRWTLGRLDKSMADADSAQRELLAKAKRAVARMADTVNTMLTISSIEAGKTALKLADTDLTAVAEQLAKDASEEAAAKGVQLETRLPGACPMRTDVSLLKEMLANLVGNAVKYTPEGGSVTVSVDDGMSYRITVADTGYGIPLYQQEKIFTKFFRGDNIVDKDLDGTGLGLYLVSGLVKVLGGQIEFRSDEGQGTVFSITLPREHPGTLAKNSP